VVAGCSRRPGAPSVRAPPLGAAWRWTPCTCLPFTTTDRLQDLAWTQPALDLALASAQAAARGWEASLRNKLGVALNDLGRHEQALTMLRQALSARERSGSPDRVRIAHWMVARTLRSLQRDGEPLAIQQRPERENAAAGTPDPCVVEELGHLYRALGDSARAADYDARARR
jgi:tetratricopeptide (TPR) repeat protein